MEDDIQIVEELLLDEKAVLKFFGGTKPLHRTTLWRGMKIGRYPRPIKIGPNSHRWLKSECEAARQAMVVARPPLDAA